MDESRHFLQNIRSRKHQQPCWTRIRPNRRHCYWSSAE